MKGKKTGGRQKGALNKVNTDLRQSITDFLQSNFNTVTKEWKTLKGKEKLAFYRDLLKYAVPVLQSTDLTMDFTKLSNEQLDHIMEGIINGEGKDEQGS